MKGPFPNLPISFLFRFVAAGSPGSLSSGALETPKGSSGQDQLQPDSEGTCQITGPSPAFRGWRVFPKPQIPSQQFFWNQLADLFEIVKQWANVSKLWNRRTTSLSDQQPPPIRASHFTRTLEDEAAFQRFLVAIITNPSTSHLVREEHSPYQTRAYPFIRAPDHEAAYHRF